MHKVAGQVEAEIGIPLLHLADATATAVQVADLGTVGLLGTRFTMEQNFYRDRLAQHGLTVLVPEPADVPVVPITRIHVEAAVECAVTAATGPVSLSDGHGNDSFAPVCSDTA